MSTALYYRQFNLFTFAHADIVEQASRLFDKVVIVVLPNTMDGEKMMDKYGVGAKIHGHFRANLKVECEIMQPGDESIRELVSQHNATVAIFDTIDNQSRSYQELQEKIARNCGMTSVYLKPEPENAEYSCENVLYMHQYSCDMRPYVIAGHLPNVQWNNQESI